jgi:endonuclease-3
MKENTKHILEALDTQYGTDLRCYLNHENAFQLLIATILSAQCTDARVNMVTPNLFKKYPSPDAFAAADLSELEQDIHSTGFYHNKAKHIIACSKIIAKTYHSIVPRELAELTALPGVGRKTANVIRGNIYGIPSIVVDTHVKRIAKRLGLTSADDPVKVEMDLMTQIPEDHWIAINIQLIALGRSICKAPTPRCDICFLREWCPAGLGDGYADEGMRMISL